MQTDREYEYKASRISLRDDCRGDRATQVRACRDLPSVRRRLTLILAGSLRVSRHHSRAGSLGKRLISAFTNDRRTGSSMREQKNSINHEERVWYDQFTSTDWVHDSIADAYRVKGLRSRKDIRGRVESFFDGAQGWILSALVGFITACIAYAVDVSEAPVYDWKDGYCSTGFFMSEKVSTYQTPLAILRFRLVIVASLSAVSSLQGSHIYLINIYSEPTQSFLSISLGVMLM